MTTAESVGPPAINVHEGQDFCPYNNQCHNILLDFRAQLNQLRFENRVIDHNLHMIIFAITETLTPY